MKIEDAIRSLRVEPGSKIVLEKDFDPGYTAEYLKKADAGKILAEGVKALAKLQDKLYAQNDYALLIIFQALDAAGKDGAIKHVMSGLNPQGVQVTSFKTPSAEELSHDFLWRCAKVLPERGKVGIFNRSYYEEVLVVRVHPEFLKAQRIPPALVDKGIWQQRFRTINAFERHLHDNGVVILKFFLNLSKGEQKKRFLARMDDPNKNWKYSPADIQERAYWNEYRKAYEDVFNHTSTKWAPWYIIPADHKWFSRLAIAAVIYTKLNELNLHYPQVDATRRQEIEKARVLLDDSVDEVSRAAESGEEKASPALPEQESAEPAKPADEETASEVLVAEIA